MKHIDSYEFLQAVVVCPQEIAAVAMLYSKVDDAVKKIEKIRTYGYSYEDINKGITLEEMKKRRNYWAKALMYAFFNANKKYHQETGKYICGKMDTSLRTAVRIYRWLDKTAI